MMLVPNLPACNQKQFIQPKARGVWEANDLNLDSLASSLAVPDDAGKNTDLKSIPDVWAQFQGFVDAFEFENHPHHSEAIGQWRALLALIALAPQNSKTYELEFRPLNLRGGSSAAIERFNAVLRQLLPQLKFDPDAGDWRDPVLMLVRARVPSNRRSGSSNAQVIGLLNPATLVAVGKNAAQLRVAGVPWLANRLIDPTSEEVRNEGDVSGLNRRDFAIISQYLDGVLVRMGQYTQDNTGNLLQALIGELEVYRDLCREYAGLVLPVMEPAPVAAAEGLAAPYDILGHSFQIGPGSYDEVIVSESLIEIRRDIDLKAGEILKGIILIDENLPSALKVPAHNIRVWRQYFLNEALRPSVYETIRAEALSQGYLLARPADFFVDELVMFEDGAEVVGHKHSNGFRSAVLPLSPLALLVLGPEAINSNLALNISGGSKYTATFKLPIAGYTHKLTREFTTDSAAGGFQVVFDQPRTMGLGLWPNFQAKGWEWNFLRFGHDPMSRDLLTRFGTSGQHLVWLLDGRQPAQREQALAQLIDSRQCRFALEVARERVTHDDSGDPIQRLRYTAKERLVEELQLSKFAFEAICFARRRADDQPAKPAGLILLPSKRPPNTVAGCSVALDFGTTNTIAYIRGPNDETARLLTLNDRVVIPVVRPKSDLQDRDIEKWAFIDFMPISQNSMPIPTVAKLPAILADGDPDLERVKALDDSRPLFSSLAFFLPAVPGVAKGDKRFSADAARLGNLKDELRFNLKWDPNPQTRETAARYLCQLIIMIGAELIDSGYDPQRARWCFSYPEALPDPENFFETIRVQLGKAFGQTAPELQQFTEAGAAAAYFLADERTPGQVSLILDIGGGTTDVALWAEDKLRWRSSFRLAGGDFFTNYLYNNPEFFGAGLLLRDLAKEVEKKPPRDILELFFYDRRFDAALTERYTSISQDQGAGLRHCALLALGGIIFYVGKIAQRLIQEGTLNTDIFDGMTIALGGRGSQIFRHFNLAAADRKSRLERVLGVFSASAGMDVEKYHPTINMSEKPKSEVAAGMLGNAETLTRAKATPGLQYLPLGEAMKVRRNSVVETLSSDANIDELLGTAIEGRPSLGMIDEFLVTLGEVAGLTCTLTDLGRRRVADEMANKLRDSLRRAKEIDDARRAQKNTSKFAPIAIEPPFIIALRTMVAVASLPKSERNKFMEMRESR